MSTLTTRPLVVEITDGEDGEPIGFAVSIHEVDSETKRQDWTLEPEVYATRSTAQAAATAIIEREASDARKAVVFDAIFTANGVDLTAFTPYDEDQLAEAAAQIRKALDEGRITDLDSRQLRWYYGIDKGLYPSV